MIDDAEAISPGPPNGADRHVVPLIEAREAGLRPGLYADTYDRGRVRIIDPRGHLGGDGRPVLATLVGAEDDQRLGHPLPRELVVRVVLIEQGACTPDGAAGLAVSVAPLIALLPPGTYPDRSGDILGLPPRAPKGTVRVRSYLISGGVKHEIERIDEDENIAWITSATGATVTVPADTLAPDLVRYQPVPA